jgi:4-amino-4-deoxy-L-arabinose transferase-like glycosyltransferase
VRKQVICGIAGAVIAASLGLLLTFSYGRDQGIYAVVGRTILEGGAPYSDAWDFKPPAIYFFYALARAAFGAAPWAIRALEALLLIAMAGSMVRIAGRFWGDRRIGLVAAAMALLVHAQLDFWHTAQPESFGGILTMLALDVGTAKRRRSWSLVAAGALLGCAGLLKPPLAGAGVVLALWVGLRDRAPLGACARAAALVLAGGVLPVAACLAWFAAVGALGDLFDTLFVFAPSYTALGWHARAALGLLAQAALDWLLGYSGPLTAGLALLLLFRRARPDDRHRGAVLLAAVVAMQLVGVAMQGKFFPYHYAACWPPTALLAALGWWRAFRRARSFVPLALAALACLALVARTASRDVPGGFWRRSALRAELAINDDRHASDALGSVADVDAASNRRVAVELARRVPLEGCVYVWGFEPVIYDLSDRRSPTRFIYNVPQRAPWARPQARAELMRDLRRRPPDAIVVASGDPLPMVLGDGSDSAAALEGFSELSAFLGERYGKLMRIDEFDLYLLREP